MFLAISFMWAGAFGFSFVGGVCPSGLLVVGFPFLEEISSRGQQQMIKQKKKSTSSLKHGFRGKLGLKKPRLIVQRAHFSPDA